MKQCGRSRLKAPLAGPGLLTEGMPGTLHTLVNKKLLFSFQDLWQELRILTVERVQKAKSLAK